MSGRGVGWGVRMDVYKELKLFVKIKKKGGKGRGGVWSG